MVRLPEGLRAFRSVSALQASLPSSLLRSSVPNKPKPLPGSEPCLGCHETGPRTGKREPGVPPPFNATALRVFYAQGMSDRGCQRCHGNPELRTAGGGRMRSLFVNQQKLSASRHARIACVQCHTGGDPSLVRPCASLKARVDCSICHANAVEQFQQSTHGQLLAKGSADAPACAECHGTHGVLGRDNPRSFEYSKELKANENAQAAARLRPLDVLGEV